MHHARQTKMKAKEKISIQPSECPFFGSDHIKKYHPPPEESGIHQGFRVVADKTCTRCGGVWSPPAPRWLAGIALLLGAGILGLGIVLLGINLDPQDGPPFMKLMSSLTKGIVCIIGMLVIASGVESLRTRKNQGIVRNVPANWRESQSNQT
jgi:hypothetical protein